MSQKIDLSSDRNVLQEQQVVNANNNRSNQKLLSTNDIAISILGDEFGTSCTNLETLSLETLSLNRNVSILENSSRIPMNSILSPLRDNSNETPDEVSLPNWSKSLTDHLSSWKFKPTSGTEKSIRACSGLFGYSFIFQKSNKELSEISTTDLTKKSKELLLQNIARNLVFYPQLYGQLDRVCKKLNTLGSAIYPKNEQDKSPCFSVKDITRHKKNAESLKNNCANLNSQLSNEWSSYEFFTTEIQPHLSKLVDHEKLNPPIKIDNFFSKGDFDIQNSDGLKEVYDLYKAYLNVLHYHGDYLRIFIRKVRITSELIDALYIWLKQQKPQEISVSESDENDSGCISSDDEKE